MQVYAIVYCPETNEVLVCKKKTIAYFFKKELKGRGISLTKKGGGKYCFPGGGLDNGEDPRAGAVREFKEETGVDLKHYHSEVEPMEISKPAYKGIVFMFSQHVFSEIMAAVSSNLNAKPNQRPLSQQDVDKSPVEDDELESVECKKVEKCMGYGVFEKERGSSTDWFYDMCSWLIANRIHE